MAHLLFKDMKGVNLSCASPASTAICPSIERQPMVRPQKAIASPLCQTPTEAKTYKQDCKKASELTSPAGSSRYLLGGRAGLDEIQEVQAAPTVPAVKREEPAVANNPQEQVVVLKVSLHCKACEGKVRKHLSKMAGVTSFNIDFAAKKVTVVGDVTPLSVLNSVSKVRNAQFWPSTPRPPVAAA